MKLIQKIKEILGNKNLDLADKLIEIENCLPKETGMSEIFGQSCQIRKEGNTVIFDGSAGCNYTDNPRLKYQDDLYYTGCGCTWDIDLDGKRYWKRYSPFITDKDHRNSRYAHLYHGDIINEKARIKKLIYECLQELGF